MSDIRKWFMKQHDKGNGASSQPSKPATTVSQPSKPSSVTEEKKETRRKTSKYFATAPPEKKQGEEKNTEKSSPVKRKIKKVGTDEDYSDEIKPPTAKKINRSEDDDFVSSVSKKKGVGISPAKETKRSRGSIAEDEKVDTPEKKPKIGSGKRMVSVDEDGESVYLEDSTPVKPAGRGSGGRGTSGGTPGGGRGRGGGRGGYMNFLERNDPPNKGQKEVPEGAPGCLNGLTFVISGTLDSLEREEAEDLIKSYGGRVTSAVSKKTNYLLVDEDIGGRKSSKAKELGVTFLSEDALFEMIRKSKPAKEPVKDESHKKITEKVEEIRPKLKIKAKEGPTIKVPIQKGSQKVSDSSVPKGISSKNLSDSLTWTEKYRPKVPNDIVGNQSLVKQLHDWLLHWDEQNLYTGKKTKGKRQSDSNAKKAVLLSGTPGIGKTTAAKLLSKMVGRETIEVNASDNRGKADSKIVKGIGGNTSNSIKELVSNEALKVSGDQSKHLKSVLIMDEVDGMSAGDRGGVADLIASIKISKIPIICICNDRYSQKLKSLVNYCLPLNFRKPTKQQMAKRLLQIAKTEGLQVDEIALEELAERVNGDIRMAINQLQYMSLSLSVIKYGDVKERLLSSSKDEDISPFTAVDKLFGYNGGKLRMDERIDLSMSDPDLVPLLIQENYINYRPSIVGRNDNGVQRMDLLARTAESIADGDIVNVQIRRYRQWQLSQIGSLASCIIPAALMHGQREVLEQGERNFNRFGGWLGKNSTAGKNLRLLEDVHVHLLASRASNVNREALRTDYFPLIASQLTHPLRILPKDEAVQSVVEFMDAYSISQEDFDTFMELSKLQGHPSLLEGIQPAVKAALTKAYKQGSSSRVVRAADMITLPGVKKAPKKRIAAILEPVEDNLTVDENGDDAVESAEEQPSDNEDQDSGVEKLQLDLQSHKSKGIRVELDLKDKGGSSTSKKATPKVKGGLGSGGAKRKK
ncbi:replication factor C subunit 1 isoform X2 [Amborella trichopoda]|nr:replication factor C subunit 1 isoform X2 [Amborella trichopoda]|eukprot:XP_006826419.2 replication factor C subunit 1 isoform X2 [Amborella trichopoda]